MLRLSPTRSAALRRGLVAAAVAWHVIVVAAALSLKTEPGAWARRYTVGYERLVGVYQGWNMFAPNPPRSDTWMVVRGVGRDGGRVELAPLVGAREDVRVEWRYLRGGKLERNLLSERRRRALKDFARRQCTPELRKIIIERVRRRTPTPAARREGAGYTLESEAAVEVRCPR